MHLDTAHVLLNKYNKNTIDMLILCICRVDTNTKVIKIKIRVGNGT